MLLGAHQIENESVTSRLIPVQEPSADAEYVSAANNIDCRTGRAACNRSGCVVADDPPQYRDCEREFGGDGDESEGTHDDETSEVARDEAMDRELLPKIRPGWVDNVMSLLRIQGSPVFGRVPTPHYLKAGVGDTVPSLTPVQSQPRSSSPSLSADEIPSSPPRPLDEIDGHEVPAHTPCEPDDAVTSSTQQSTP